MRSLMWWCAVIGVELFQPSSAIATAAIAIMIFNSGKQLLSRRPSQVTHQYLKSFRQRNLAQKTLAADMEKER